MQDWARLPLLKNTTVLHALAGLNTALFGMDDNWNVAGIMSHRIYSFRNIVRIEPLLRICISNNEMYKNNGLILAHTLPLPSALRLSARIGTCFLFCIYPHICKHAQYLPSSLPLHGTDSAHTPDCYSFFSQYTLFPLKITGV